MRTLILLLLLLAPPAFALDPGEMFADPALEERARAVGRDLRCLKCRNQSIFDSNAGIAKDLRVVVRERIAAGDSDREILAYVQDRFGDYVLLKPPVAAHTYALWLTPPALVLIAGLAFAAYMRKPRRTPETLSDEDRTAARALLKETR
ncbi:MAG: cytochrome c-type biogenesis protein CcmH [Rhodobacter sp.]|nr:cytochrome c-type biogenesis protein CcmH [Rhodobacter sp.]